jgi:AcrR family transcriptional regulator
MAELTKTEQRHADLRLRLIEIAAAQIATEGAASLKARDLAARAGCAVGAIYNVFDDMTALVMQVNLQSFAALRQVADDAIRDAADLGPREQLIRLGQAYLGFAVAHYHPWRALFEVSADLAVVPDWYQGALDQLFASIAPPVQALFPALSEADLDLMVEALFSSVHGIVLLGLQNRAAPASTDEIARKIGMVLGRLGN